MTTTLTAPDGTRFRTGSTRRFIAAFHSVDGRIVVHARSDTLAVLRKRCYHDSFIIDRVTDKVVHVGGGYSHTVALSR